MKKWQKIASGSLLIALGLSACGKKTPSSSSRGGSTPTPATFLPESGNFLAQNGESDYVIVMPSQPSEKENMAKDELISSFAKSTGITLSSLTDEDVAYAPSSHFISLGENQLAKSLGLSASEEELTNQGYRIVTRDASVFIFGPGKKSTLYGVYEFMEHEIGYKAYADDEISLESKEEVPLYEFDIHAKPDFEQRALGHYYTSQDETYRDQMRVEAHGEGWIYASHSHFTILPPSLYRADHPDWYSSDGTQLNLTNEKMRAEFVARLKDIIHTHPEEKYILLGEEDSNTFCQCEECQKEVATYGSYSAVDIRFVNKVAKEIQDWLVEEEGGRSIYIGTFAYLKTFDPPAHQTEEGEWVPNDPSCVTIPGVFVFMAPLQANFSFSFHDEANYSAVGRQMDGWKACTNMVNIWTYSRNYLSYWTPFNQYGALTAQLKEFKRLQARSVVDLGAWDTATPFFDKMQIYVISQLMWNTSFSYDVLADDFLRHYYKNAYEPVRRYYDMERNHTQWLHSKYGIDGTCYIDMKKSEYWSKGFLNECMEALDEALSKAKDIQTSDPATYEKLVARINALRVGPLFHLLNHYQSQFVPSKQNEMIGEVEEYAAANGFLYWHEHTNLTLGGDGSVTELIAGWRRSVM